MKVRLLKEQTNYMNAALQSLLSIIVPQRDLDEKSVRALYKMRYKFAPNSLDVYLTGVERSILLNMLNYRAKQLSEAGSITDESEMVSEITKTLQNGN